MRAQATRQGVVGVTLELFQLNPRTTHRLGTLACFLVVVIFAGPASAAKHPVPLDPKADPATCITCHENKTKGKSVHSAMQSAENTFQNTDFPANRVKPPSMRVSCLHSTDPGNLDVDH